MSHKRTADHWAQQAIKHRGNGHYAEAMHAHHIASHYYGLAKNNNAAAIQKQHSYQIAKRIGQHHATGTSQTYAQHSGILENEAEKHADAGRHAEAAFTYGQAAAYATHAAYKEHWSNWVGGHQKAQGLRLKAAENLRKLANTVHKDDTQIQQGLLQQAKDHEHTAKLQGETSLRLLGWHASAGSKTKKEAITELKKNLYEQAFKSDSHAVHVQKDLWKMKNEGARQALEAAAVHKAHGQHALALAKTEEAAKFFHAHGQVPEAMREFASAADGYVKLAAQQTNEDYKKELYGRAAEMNLGLAELHPAGSTDRQYYTNQADIYNGHAHQYARHQLSRIRETMETTDPYHRKVNFWGEHEWYKSFRPPNSDHTYDALMQWYDQQGHASLPVKPDDAKAHFHEAANAAYALAQIARNHHDPDNWQYYLNKSKRYMEYAAGNMNDNDTDFKEYKRNRALVQDEKTHRALLKRRVEEEHAEYEAVERSEDTHQLIKQYNENEHYKLNSRYDTNGNFQVGPIYDRNKKPYAGRREGTPVERKPGHGIGPTIGDWTAHNAAAQAATKGAEYPYVDTSEVPDTTVLGSKEPEPHSQVTRPSSAGPTKKGTFMANQVAGLPWEAWNNPLSFANNAAYMPRYGF